MRQRKPKKIFQKFLPFFLKKFAEIKRSITFVSLQRSSNKNRKTK
jgi:hypothetical protein